MAEGWPATGVARTQKRKDPCRYPSLYRVVQRLSVTIYMCIIVLAHANGTKPEMFRSAQHDKDLSPNTMAGIFAVISTGLRDF
jgi:hypothetical protein